MNQFVINAASILSHQVSKSDCDFQKTHFSFGVSSRSPEDAMNAKKKSSRDWNKRNPEKRREYQKRFYLKKRREMEERYG